MLTRYEDGYPFTLEHSITNLAKEVIRQRTREMEIFLFQENQYVLLLSSRDSVDVYKRQVPFGPVHGKKLRNYTGGSF